MEKTNVLLHSARIGFHTPCLVCKDLDKIIAEKERLELKNGEFMTYKLVITEELL